MYEILREFLSHNFVSGLRTLKPNKLFLLKKNLDFYRAEWNETRSSDDNSVS